MNRIVLINILYLFILIAAALLPEGISNYNAYVLLAVSVVYALQIRSFGVYVSTLVCGGLICAVSIFQYPLYGIIDSVLIFFLFCSIYAGSCFRVDMCDLRLIRGMYFFVLLAMVVGMANSSFWSDGDEMRYIGIFHSGNSSASMFLMLGIAIWEMEKKEKGRVCILFLLITITLLYMWASGTRSMLFCLPYWLYQMFGRTRTRILVILLLIAGVLYLPVFVESIVEKMRLEEDDPSIMTRSVIYQLLLSGICDNYALIPQGSHSGWDMVRDFTGDPTFSPHNDFLNFIYEWGVIFYLFCVIVAMKLKCFLRLNFEFILILLALSSCALHNILFNVIIWIPFTVILMVRRATDEIRKVCYEQS